MSLESLPADEPLSFTKAFRHLLVFQLKLFFDAFRDLLFSPISLIVFLIDAVTRPTVGNSMSMRMMHMGRRSDRLINLFDEYTNAGDYTIDQTVAEVEVALHKEMIKRRDKAAPQDSV